VLRHPHRSSRRPGLYGQQFRPVQHALNVSHALVRWLISLHSARSIRKHLDRERLEREARRIARRGSEDEPGEACGRGRPRHGEALWASLHRRAARGKRDLRRYFPACSPAMLAETAMLLDWPLPLRVPLEADSASQLAAGATLLVQVSGQARPNPV
jgi:hypothetical protein